MRTDYRIVAPLAPFLFLTVSAFTIQPPQSLLSTIKIDCYNKHQFSSIISSVLFASTTPTTLTSTICNKNKDEPITTDENDSSSSSSSSYWLDKGLLLSSFNNGLKANPNAIDWLMKTLIESLWKEEQQKTLKALEKSNIFSPCNGPDPIILEQLENIDRVVVKQQEIIHNNDDNSNSEKMQWMKNLELLCKMKMRMKMKMKNQHYVVDGDDDDDDKNDNPQQSLSHPLLSIINLRILYIPTAIYALRPDSSSSPGKQRGRNRTDARKRRTEIIRLLANQLEEQQQASYSPSVIHNSNNNKEDEDSNRVRQHLRQVYNIRTVTLDFDDGSVKQPELVTVGDTTNSNDGVPSTENGIKFPKSGKEAIREWEPHLIYVQGGNTFWLHHCMEKGDWTQDLIDACCCNSNDATNTDQDSSPLPPSLLSPFSAVYCGVSAGAILAGQHLQTASWKVRNRYIYKRD
mmetsp:Transcript_53226/g.57773  ORF Transcript_53226/g.57773 Transcript_53226/m.57773 type:complete len:460 (-) Transcript_53226:584-1963(-)